MGRRTRLDGSDEDALKHLKAQVYAVLSPLRHGKMSEDEWWAISELAVGGVQPHELQRVDLLHPAVGAAAEVQLRVRHVDDQHAQHL